MAHIHLTVPVMTATAVLLTAVLAAGPLGPGNHTRTLTVEGRDRRSSRTLVGQFRRLAGAGDR